MRCARAIRRNENNVSYRQACCVAARATIGCKPPNNGSRGNIDTDRAQGGGLAVEAPSTPGGAVQYKMTSRRISKKLPTHENKIYCRFTKSRVKKSGVIVAASKQRVSI